MLHLIRNRLESIVNYGIKRANPLILRPACSTFAYFHFLQDTLHNQDYSQDYSQRSNDPYLSILIHISIGVKARADVCRMSNLLLEAKQAKQKNVLTCETFTRTKKLKKGTTKAKGSKSVYSNDAMDNMTEKLEELDILHNRCHGLPVEHKRSSENQVENNFDKWFEVNSNIESANSFADVYSLFFSPLASSQSESMQILQDLIKPWKPHWSCCTLLTYNVQNKTYLFVSRLTKNLDNSPIVLSISRCLNRESDALQQVTESFFRIMQENNETLTLSSRENHIKLTSQQRKDWWERREHLNQELESFALSFDKLLLGPWRGILRGVSLHSTCEQVTRRLIQLIYSLKTDLEVVVGSDLKSVDFGLCELLMDSCDLLTVDDVEMALRDLLCLSGLSCSNHQCLVHGYAISNLHSFIPIVDFVFGQMKNTVDSQAMPAINSSNKAVHCPTHSLNQKFSSFIENNRDVDSAEEKSSEDDQNQIEFNLNPETMKVAELRAELKRRGVSCTGLKSVLVDRLKQEIQSSQTTKSSLKNKLRAEQCQTKDSSQSQSNARQDMHPRKCLSKQKGSFFPCVLALCSELEALPWECSSTLTECSTTRLPGVHFMTWLANKVGDEGFLLDLKPEDCAFIVNPSGDLLKTENRLKAVFETIGWEGITNRQPTSEEMKELLTTKNLVVYCGHGTG